MSVTQSYKTVTFSDQQHLHVVLAVMTQLRVDNAAKRTPGDEYDKFLAAEIALGVGVLAVLNSVTATPAARGPLNDLDGRNLRTAIQALHFMLHTLRSGPFDKVTDVLDGQVIVSPDALNAALLFLENPK